MVSSSAGSAHMGSMTHAPDPEAEGLSINDYCAQLPRRRFAHQAHGLILRLPRTGLVVVPCRWHKYGWDAVVVEGHGDYPVGGYDIYISNNEIETAIEVRLGEEVPVQLVTAETAEKLENGSWILTRSHGALAKQIVDSQTRWGRTAFKKVSVSTEEIAAEFPVVVTSTTSAVHGAEVTA